MGRGQKIFIVVLLVVFGIPVIALGYLYVSISGGPEAIWLNSLPAPDQHKPEVVQARADARAALRPSLDVLDRSTVLDAGPESYAANCERGQNNYKVHEGYKHVCAVTVGRFYGWHGDFPAMARALHAELVADGWEPDFGDGLSGLADQYETGLNPYETPTPGVTPPPIDFGWSWSAYYTRDEGRTSLRLGFANEHTTDLDALDYMTGRSGGQSWSDTRETVDAATTVADLLQQSDGVLLGTLEREYFRAEE